MNRDMLSRRLQRRGYERQRLSGHVERILQKGAYSRESLLAEVREMVAACVARRRGAR